MSQVKLSVGFNVVGAANPLVVTPSSAIENLTVGTAVDGTSVAVVSGGQAPYNYALDPTSDPMPDGVSLVEDAVGNIALAGKPTTATTVQLNVVLNITDAAGAQVQLRRTIG